jgi:hypothetical protein
MILISFLGERLRRFNDGDETHNLYSNASTALADWGEGFPGVVIATLRYLIILGRK